jgi:plasmid stabilization system protein ParE
MPYKVERSVDTDADLEAIFDFLVQSYVEFGEAKADAIERAAKRLDVIEEAMLALGKIPHQGTKRDDILPGLRSVTKDRAIFYFDVDDKARRVRVLAIFFGGQDHRRAMLKRLLGQR